MIFIPLPLHATHFCTAPALHNTFLLSCSFVVFPLYRSSRDTLRDEGFQTISCYYGTTYWSCQNTWKM
uniref:Uncharacterized protein n=1 Tax=Poecilia latipinna TaxID=48699 RepID=A0A3B3VK80_9TELE